MACLQTLVAFMARLSCIGLCDEASAPRGDPCGSDEEKQILIRKDTDFSMQELNPFAVR